MRAILSYLKVCESCNGTGDSFVDMPDGFSKPLACPDCTSGYTLEVMEFKQLDDDIMYCEESNLYLRDKKFCQFSIHKLEGADSIYKYTGYWGDNILESLNPQLTIIDEEECPECLDHPGRQLPVTRPKYSDVVDLNLPCLNCKDGTIEKETLIVFDKKEYEAEIRKDATLEIVIAAQSSITGMSYEADETTKSICDEITRRFQEKLKEIDNA